MKNKKRILDGLGSVVSARDLLTDEQAANVPNLYPEWKIGIVYDPNGVEGPNRFTYNGILYKVLAKHTSQSDWVPGNVPAVYAQIYGGQEGTAPEEWKQPIGNTNTYMKGARCYWPTKDDHLYESLYDNNAYSPGAWPDGWKLIE